jgi:hypothetical protein
MGAQGQKGFLDDDSDVEEEVDFRTRYLPRKQIAPPNMSGPVSVVSSSSSKPPPQHHQKAQTPPSSSSGSKPKPLAVPILTQPPPSNANLNSNPSALRFRLSPPPGDSAAQLEGAPARTPSRHSIGSKTPPRKASTPSSTNNVSPQAQAQSQSPQFGAIAVASPTAGGAGADDNKKIDKKEGASGVHRPATPPTAATAADAKSAAAAGSAPAPVASANKSNTQQWTCYACTFAENKFTSAKCEVCATARDDAKAEATLKAEKEAHDAKLAAKAKADEKGLGVC